MEPQNETNRSSYSFCFSSSCIPPTKSGNTIAYCLDSKYFTASRGIGVLAYVTFLFYFLGGKCRRQYSTTNVQWNSRKYIKKLPAADTKSNLFINHSSFVLCLRIVDLSHNCVILYQTALHKLYLLQIVNVLSFHTNTYLYFIFV